MNNHLTLILRKQREQSSAPLFITCDGFMLTRIAKKREGATAEWFTVGEWTDGDLTFEDKEYSSALSFPAYRTRGGYLRFVEGVAMIGGIIYKVYPSVDGKASVFVAVGVGAACSDSDCPWCEGLTR